MMVKVDSAIFIGRNAGLSITAGQSSTQGITKKGIGNPL
jgi:hypothetical protein